METTDMTMSTDVTDLKEPVLHRVDVRQLFMNHQGEMAASLTRFREDVEHPTAKGDGSEARWRKMLQTYLPKRYQADSAFVVDSNGNRSEQIDVVIYDQQYTPFLFKEDGATYVPAESVYAVLEVKPTLKKGYVEYAGKKAETVRMLNRTSAVIHYAGGVMPPKPIERNRILAGIVALDCDWKHGLGNSLRSTLNGLSERQQIDLGCALNAGAFSCSYGKADSVELDVSSKDEALVTFFLKLVAELQKLGTVPAIDILEWSRALL